MSSTEDPGAFLAALRGERPDRRPIWVMRQAGRYLPEYHRVRASHSFVEICKTPELACEVTLQPIRRFAFDAAILFNDILLPLEPAGAKFAFTDSGPRLERPLREESQIAGLEPFEPRESLGFVSEAIRLVKRELNGTPLIGFAGAPLTLAAYLIEGRPSKDYRHLKSLRYSRPDLLASLLERLADQTARYLEMQIEAGADAVQLFDSCAMALTPDDYRHLALPGVRRIFDALARTRAHSILFVKGGSAFLPLIGESGADAASLHWSVDISEAVERLEGMKVQGNLDPLALLGPHEQIRRRALAICRAADRAPGHVFNLGHGILPGTPVEGVEALVEAVRAHTQEEAA